MPYALTQCRRIKIKYFAIRSGLAVVKNLGDGFFDLVARLGSGGSVAEAADDFGRPLVLLLAGVVALPTEGVD